MGKKRIYLRSRKLPEASLEDASGEIRYSMTNDFVFKAVLERNEDVLIGLLSSLLHREATSIRSAKVTNPIILGEQITDKTIIMDVRVNLDNNESLDLEMQVIDKGDWRERSVYYLCRDYADLRKGGNYTDSRSSIHIGFLDFPLFPEDSEFYATNYLMNARSHKIYTDKLRLSVVNLTQIENATEEDRFYKIDRWARLFKAGTWEEFRMIAEKNQAMLEAGNELYQMSIDEVYQEQMERSKINAMFDRAVIERLKSEAREAKSEAREAKKERDTLLALLKKNGIDPDQETIES